MCHTEGACSGRYVQRDAAVQRLLCETEGEMVLCGHSSGANICALALLDNMDTTPISEQPSHPSANASTKAKDCSQTHSALNIGTFIGLAGVYDIGKHYLFESNRGVQVISPMSSAACGRKLFGLCSPTVVAQNMALKLTTSNHNSVNNSNRNHSNRNSSLNESILFKTSFPKTVLIHGWGDATVPISSSIEFSHALEAIGTQVYMKPVEVKIRIIYNILYV